MRLFTSDSAEVILLQSLESAPSVGGEGKELEQAEEANMMDFSGLYLRMITLAETMVYARKVPIDINSTRCWRSNKKAIRALMIPLMAKFAMGTCVRSLTLPINEKRSPSLAIEYMVLGKENREPKSVVVIPHRAPMLELKTTSFNH